MHARDQRHQQRPAPARPARPAARASGGHARAPPQPRGRAGCTAAPGARAGRVLGRAAYSRNGAAAAATRAAGRPAFVARQGPVAQYWSPRHRRERVLCESRACAVTEPDASDRGPPHRGRRLGGWAGDRNPRARGHPHRRRRGRAAPARRGAGARPTWSPPRTPGGCAGSPRRSASHPGPGRVVLRGQRVGPHPRTGRGARGRRAGAAGHGRGHAVRLRPRVPAGRGRRREGHQGHGRARPLRRAHRARAVRAARRPLLLRGVPAAQGGRAPRPPAGGRRASGAPSSTSRPRTASTTPSPRWPRCSAPSAGPPSAGS